MHKTDDTAKFSAATRLHLPAGEFRASDAVIIVTVASPAFRLITAGVMLEGLGAALTAFCLYAYLRARAVDTHERWWWALAIGLLLLFFEKSNYWVVAAVPLAVAFFSEDVTGWVAWFRARLAGFDGDAAVRDTIRDPLLIAAAVIVCVVVVLYARGPTALDLFGRRVSLYPPENLVTAIWWLLFIRGALSWAKHRKAFNAVIGVAGGRLFYWLLVPIAISFLIPKRLSTLRTI